MAPCLVAGEAPWCFPVGCMTSVVSKAIFATMAAKAFDMKVSTAGSLLDWLSHHRNGWST